MLGVFILGVDGVLILNNGVFDKDLLGDGLIDMRNFCVASLLAAGDIVFNRSIVDLGEGLK